MTELIIQPSETAQTVELTLSDWENWQPSTMPTAVEAAFVPVKDGSFLTQIELSPEMSPSWRAYAPIGLSTLSEMGANSVVFTPQWFTSLSNDQVFPVLGKTPFTYELEDLLISSKNMGLQAGLFPQVGPTDRISAIWETFAHSLEWWQNLV